MIKEYIARGEALMKLMQDGCSAKNVESIMNIPAADVAPVVRCKECKHWNPSGSKAGNSFSDMEYIGGCEFTNYCRRESDFCSYGEKRRGKDGTT